MKICCQNHSALQSIRFEDQHRHNWSSFGYPGILLLAILGFLSSSLSFFLAAHPDYISVCWEQLEYIFLLTQWYVNYLGHAAIVLKCWWVFFLKYILEHWEKEVDLGRRCDIDPNWFPASLSLSFSVAQTPKAFVHTENIGIYPKRTSTKGRVGATNIVIIQGCTSFCAKKW